MERPIDTLKGALKSKSILLFTVLQLALAAAQPYLASTGIDPLLANMVIDISAVIILRVITKSSLAEKGSGFEKVKTLIEGMDSFLENPFYRSMLIPVLQKKGIDISAIEELSNDTMKYADAKTYLIGGSKFRKMTDGSFVPVE
jgi:hypothetical protein